jgi:hypothetical protein
LNLPQTQFQQEFRTGCSGVWTDRTDKKLPPLHTSIEIVDDLKRMSSFELPGIIAVFLTIKAGELKFSFINNL